MVKYISNFLFIFLILTSLSFAKDDDSKLKREYGQDLTHVPFFLRFDFSKKYGIDWKDTYYAQRRVFLKDYDISYEAEQKKEKAEARAEADRKKAYLIAKRDALLKEKHRIMNQLIEEQNQKKADAERLHDFIKVINSQEQQIAQMNQQIEEDRKEAQRR